MTTDDSDFKDKFFEQLSRIRSIPSDGGQPLVFIEKILGSKVPMLFWEPDPLTSHNDYYYNTRQNVLYKRKIISNVRAVWFSVVTV